MYLKKTKKILLLEHSIYWSGNTLFVFFLYV